MMRRTAGGALAVVAGLALAGCSSVPSEPTAVGEGYPGTCLPAELSWPTDFLDSLPGESSGVSGTIVGLRLEYADSTWVWRLRSAGTARNSSGDTLDDTSVGTESIVDVRTLEVVASHETELTDAERTATRTGAFEAAQLSGEKWPTPLIIEMTRVMDGAAPAWRITTCDTATNEHSVMTVH